MIPKPILIDTNLLLLYLIGIYSEDLISKTKRLKLYTVEQFRLLRAFLDKAPKVLITSNISTEISNLMDLDGEYRKGFFKAFDTFLQNSMVEEIQLESKLVSSRKEFTIYGLTDAGINSLAKRYLILTDDSRLYDYYCKNICTSKNPDDEIINFYHIIQYTWN
ncbi:PIN domain-containing protein [Kosakonia cowanii]